MENVQSGKLLDFIDRLLNTVDKVFDSLSKMGVETEKVKTEKDGSVIYKFNRSEIDNPKPSEIILAKVKPAEDGKTVSILVQTKDKKNQKKYDSVRNEESEINHIITDYIKKVLGDGEGTWTEKKVANDEKFDESEFEDTNSQKKISLTLKKVTSSEETNIELVSVLANYASSEVLDDLNSIISDDEFVATIPEDECASFEVVCLPDDQLDVIPSDTDTPDISMADFIGPILCSGYNLYFTAMQEEIRKRGQEWYEFRTLCNSIMWTVGDQLRSIYNMFKELDLDPPYIPDVLNLCKGQRSDLLNDVCGKLTEYIASLELYYCNVPHDVQALMDKWIRELNILAADLRASFS